MKKNNRLILALSIVVAGSGFLLPFWPLSVLGILLAASGGLWFGAICIGLLLDVAYGAPTGQLHFILFPFTLVALGAILGRSLAGRHLLHRGRQEKI